MTFEAAAKSGAVDVMPYHYWGECNTCVFLDLGRAYQAANMRDSAIASYEHALNGPLTLGGMSWDLPFYYEQLCALHAAAGDYDRAPPHCEKFVGYWESADQELQPRVAEAKRIMAMRR